MKKLLFAVLVFAMLLSGCKEEGARTYEMTLLSGESIVVTYDICFVYNYGIGCWNDYQDFTAPDAFYGVSSFNEVTE